MSDTLGDGPDGDCPKQHARQTAALPEVHRVERFRLVAGPVNFCPGSRNPKVPTGGHRKDARPIPLAKEKQPVLPEYSIAPLNRDLPAQILLGYFPAMRGDRARSQLWAFAYVAVRSLLELVVLITRCDDAKEIEYSHFATKSPCYGAK